MLMVSYVTMTPVVLFANRSYLLKKKKKERFNIQYISPAAVSSGRVLKPVWHIGQIENNAAVKWINSFECQNIQKNATGSNGVWKKRQELQIMNKRRLTWCLFFLPLFPSLTHTHTHTHSFSSALQAIFGTVWIIGLVLLCGRTIGAWFQQKKSDEWLFPEPYKAPSALLHWCVDSTKLAAQWIYTLDFWADRCTRTLGAKRGF